MKSLLIIILTSLTVIFLSFLLNMASFNGLSKKKEIIDKKPKIINKELK